MIQVRILYYSDTLKGNILIKKMFFLKFFEQNFCTHSWCARSIIKLTSSISDTKVELRRFLIEANEKSEWLWRFYFKYMTVAGANTSMMFVLSIAVDCWINGNEFNTKNLFHAFKLVLVSTSLPSEEIVRQIIISSYISRFYSLPWNQSTPLGYFGEFCFSIGNGLLFLFGNGIFLVLFISMCWYHVAFSKRFQYSVQQLDHLDRFGNCVKPKALLCDIIRFHVLIKK